MVIDITDSPENSGSNSNTSNVKVQKQNDMYHTFGELPIIKQVGQPLNASYQNEMKQYYRIYFTKRKQKCEIRFGLVKVGVERRSRFKKKSILLWPPLDEKDVENINY